MGINFKASGKLTGFDNTSLDLKVLLLALYLLKTENYLFKPEVLYYPSSIILVGPLKELLLTSY